MLSGSQQKSVVFILIGIFSVALAVALNIGWIVVSWRQGLLLLLGVIFFCVIIAGVTLNTIFLVREVRKNEQHDTFINSVTHELKTPVASIRLYLETLQSRDVGEQKRKEFYEIMLADSDRLLATINQVLRAARSGRAVRHHVKSMINMNTLVDECVLIARRRHHLPEEAVEARFSESPPNVKGDPEELQAAVLNLLDNAVKYSTAGNVQIRVEVSMPERDTVQICVEDQGIGISRDQLGRIFKRFYRVPEGVATRIHGTGLGLFIVRSVVKRHGGKTFARSPGKGLGSSFTIRLPAAQQAT